MLIPAAMLALSQPAAAVENQTLDVARERLYPGQQLTPADFKLTPDQLAKLKSEYKVPALRPAFKAWRAADGGWLFLDQVYGLSDIVTYLVAVNADGTVKGIEVLVCAEGFCDMFTPEWRAKLGSQVHGKWEPRGAVTIVSGATYSSVHVAEGVKKILAIHARFLPGKSS